MLLVAMIVDPAIGLHGSNTSKHRLLMAARLLAFPLQQQIQRRASSFGILYARQSAHAARRSNAVVATRTRLVPHPTYQSSNFLSDGTKIEQVRDRKGQEASPENRRHHVQTNARRDRNRSKRCLRN